MHGVLPDEYKMNSNFFPINFYYNTFINDLTFRRETLLTPAHPPLGVTENTTDSYEPPESGL